MQSDYVTEREIKRWRREIKILFGMAVNVRYFEPDEREIAVLLQFLRDMLDVIIRLQEEAPFRLSHTSIMRAIDEWACIEKEEAAKLMI